MTAAEDRREELEALIRQRVGGAYRYGLAAMSFQASAPLGYPEENRDVDAILAAVDGMTRPGPPRPDPRVHYALGRSGGTVPEGGTA